MIDERETYFEGESVYMNVNTHVIYFDVETQRSAQEVGGWNYVERLGLALAVTYDTRDNNYRIYDEASVANLVEALHAADLVVGFNHLNFDYKVLSAYTETDLQSLPNFDMHAQLWEDERLRVGLNKLGQHTLGSGKTADGLDSIRWWRLGQTDKVAKYCKQDVALTKDLFLHACNEGYLLCEYQNRTRRFDTEHWAGKASVLVGESMSDALLQKTFDQPVRFVTYSGIRDLSAIETVRHQVLGSEKKTGSWVTLDKFHILFAFAAENMEAIKPNIKKRPILQVQNLPPISSREEINHESDEVFAEASQRRSKVTVITRAGYVLRGYIQCFDRDVLYMRISGRFVIVYRHGILELQNGIV